MSSEQPFLRLAESERPLRGGCHCGRNRYVVSIPQNGRESAHVLFNTNPTHQSSFANPLPAFLRVPLAWYQSSTHAIFDDESAHKIHRVYSPAWPSQECAQHGFCGFCGTPLTYWCENPISEANYIQITLGSLDSEDLRDLDDLGFVSDSDESGEEAGAAHEVSKSIRKGSTGVPWLDELMQAAPHRTRAQAPTRTHVVHEKKTSDGTIRVEWEISEWNDETTPVGESPDDGEGMEWSSRSHVRS